MIKTHASLFSGIGAADLAAEWMGWENLFHCEFDKKCQRLLKYYWPSAFSYGNIKETDFTRHRGAVDVLSGGFPCQGFSIAGKRKGDSDDRYLWPEMYRAITEIKPSVVVPENVPGIINWGGGSIFRQVLSDLEAEGFEICPVVLPAAMVKAPHGRDRVWFVAYSDSNFRRNENRNEGSSFDASNSSGDGHQSGGLEENRRKESKSERQQKERKRVRGNDRGIEQPRHAANTNSGERCERRGNTKRPQKTIQQFASQYDPRNAGKTWGDFPTQWPIRSGYDGLSDRLDGITLDDWHDMTLKQCGNSMVPQVVYQIFKAIETTLN